MKANDLRNMSDEELGNTLKETQKRLFELRFQAATGLTLDVRWGARPSRPREMLRPWMTADPPPGWAPAVALDDGLAALVRP